MQRTHLLFMVQDGVEAIFSSYRAINDIVIDILPVPFEFYETHHVHIHVEWLFKGFKPRGDLFAYTCDSFTERHCFWHGNGFVFGHEISPLLIAYPFSIGPLRINPTVLPPAGIKAYGDDPNQGHIGRSLLDLL
jgi:hypothetical protein